MGQERPQIFSSSVIYVKLEGTNLKALKTFLSSVGPIIIFSLLRTDKSWRFLVLVVLRQAGLFTLPPCSLLIAFKEAAGDNPEQRQEPIMRFIYSLFFFKAGLWYVSQTVLALLSTQRNTFLIIYIFKMCCFKFVLSPNLQQCIWAVK